MKNKKNITVIGGGTGQSTILRGLKTIDCNINAIVTMADNGGSSGLLREDLGMLPPGDIRNCIIALADTEPDMESLMQYRFTEGRLKGQNFGNLFLAALNDIYCDFELAVSKVSKLLRVKGNIRPVTLDDVNIAAHLKNNNTVIGESIIASESKRQQTAIDKVYLIPDDVKPFSEAINAIEKADIIVLGPGSLYTSILPNLLVDGISQSIYKSKAKKIYISNIMTEDGETNGYRVKDFVDAIYYHVDIGKLDYIIVNDEKVPKQTKEKYIEKNQTQVILTDEERKYFEEKEIELIETNLVEIKSELVYHNGRVVSEILKKIT